jgi:membrane protein
VDTGTGRPLARQARLIGLASWRGVWELYNSDGLTHAASIAYYALLSLFPFVLLALSMASRLTADPESRDAVIAFAFQYFPRQFGFITGQIDAFRTSTVQLGFGGFLALTWAALGVFSAVSSAVNHAWNVEKRRSYLMHQIVSFLMLLSAGTILLVALLLVSAVRLARTNWFYALIPSSPVLTWMSGVTADYAATGLLIGCVALIFYYIPNTRIRFRDVWPGAVVVGVLWRVLFSGFSWYASDMARWNLIHGSIAAVVVFLFWVYLCAVILLYGVEMTAAYARLQDGDQPQAVTPEPAA